MVTISRLNHITINAPSGEQEKIRWFYHKVMGLKEITPPAKLTEIYEIIWFQLLDFLLHIEFTKNFVKPIRDESGPIMPGAHFAIEVENIKTFREELQEKGVAIKEAVTLADRDRFYLVDPFDNYIEIIQFYKK